MSLKTRPHDSFVAVGTYVLIRANLYIIRRYAQPVKWSQKCRSFVTRTPLLFAINERNECIRTKEAYNHPPPHFSPVEKSLTTFIYTFALHFVPRVMIAGAQRPSACKQRLRGKSVSHQGVRDNTHAPAHTYTHRHIRTRTPNFSVSTRREKREVQSPLSLSLSRYLEEARAPNVTLLCNFNNHILRSSRIRWRMTRILLVAFSTLVCRVTSPAIAEENRAELLALTARKKGRHTKDPAARPRGYTDSSIMNSSTLHLHSVRAENCLRAICVSVTALNFSMIRVFDIRNILDYIPDNAFDYYDKLKLLKRSSTIAAGGEGRGGKNKRLISRFALNYKRDRRSVAKQSFVRP